jgi:hypothetical protein
MIDASTIIWASADIARDLDLEISGVEVNGLWVSFSRESVGEIATLLSNGTLGFNPELTTAADYRAILGIAKYHELELIEVGND